MTEKFQDVKGTSREVGVNLKQGYNGELTSKQAGSVGGQMVKKMSPARTIKFTRGDRTAAGHEVEVTYIVEVDTYGDSDLMWYSGLDEPIKLSL